MSKATCIKQYFSDGSLASEIFFLGDEMHGSHKEYYANGKVMISGSYLNNERHGLHTGYDEFGKVTSEDNYVNGQLHGNVADYRDGVCTYRCSYRFDKKHGIACYYSGNGELYKHRSYYINGSGVSAEVWKEHQLITKLAGLGE